MKIRGLAVGRFRADPRVFVLFSRPISIRPKCGMNYADRANFGTAAMGCMSCQGSNSITVRCFAPSGLRKLGGASIPGAYAARLIDWRTVGSNMEISCYDQRGCPAKPEQGFIILWACTRSLLNALFGRRCGIGTGVLRRAFEILRGFSRPRLAREENTGV